MGSPQIAFLWGKERNLTLSLRMIGKAWDDKDNVIFGVLIFIANEYWEKIANISKKRILNKKNRCSTPILKQLQKIKTMKVIRLNKMLNKIDVTNEFYIVFSNNLYILH